MIRCIQFTKDYDIRVIILPIIIVSLKCTFPVNFSWNKCEITQCLCSLGDTDLPINYCTVFRSKVRRNRSSDRSLSEPLGCYLWLPPYHSRLRHRDRVATKFGHLTAATAPHKLRMIIKNKSTIVGCGTVSVMNLYAYNYR